MKAADWAVILVAAGITFCLRYVPLLAVNRLRDQEWVKQLAGLMPGGIMLILVAYTLVEPSRTGPLWTWLVALAATAAVHLWRRNALVTMLVGIAVYAALAALV
ncbi:AzlD domain-containing protein [Acidipropionibacterium timonense]|uniref:AzlD domain-containing protein n=1 Tax=Acidipropionibacterium timonense TaxID=2161818 RepID=UPI001032681C|nr:AzlD domain-containing protein [Acidipropionibacterium timonense]